MKNKLLILILFVVGVIVYYGLLVVPPRVKFGNLITFVIYMSAAIYLIYKYGKKDNQPED